MVSRGSSGQCINVYLSSEVEYPSPLLGTELRNPTDHFSSVLKSSLNRSNWHSLTRHLARAGDGAVHRVLHDQVGGGEEDRYTWHLQTRCQVPRQAGRNRRLHPDLDLLPVWRHPRWQRLPGLGSLASQILSNRTLSNISINGKHLSSIK